MVRCKRFVASVMVFVVCVFVAGYAGEGSVHAFYAQEALDDLTQGLTPLDDDAMDDIAGEYMGQIILGSLIAYSVTQVLDYYGVGTWMQETAIPAVESAFATTYDTVRGSMTSFDLGEAFMTTPYIAPYGWYW